MLATLAVVGALLAADPATAQPEADIVPRPSGGPSDLDAVVPPVGQAAAGVPSAAAGPQAGTEGDITRLHVRFSADAGPVLAGDAAILLY